MKIFETLVGFKLNSLKIKLSEFFVTRKEMVERCMDIFGLSLAEAY